ncbi:MAG TPA: hypothetical protein VK362_21490, partial [Reyranella sp.]|nr:hypothetical protein [Reyranella sp.]
MLAAVLERSLPLAVYLLSFWHYGLYWLAVAFGAITFDVFKRDAVAMKTVFRCRPGARLSPRAARCHLAHRHRRRHPAE